MVAAGVRRSGRQPVADVVGFGAPVVGFGFRVVGFGALVVGSAVALLIPSSPLRKKYAPTMRISTRTPAMPPMISGSFDLGPQADHPAYTLACPVPACAPCLRLCAVIN